MSALLIGRKSRADGLHSASLFERRKMEIVIYVYKPLGLISIFVRNVFATTGLLPIEFEASPLKSPLGGNQKQITMWSFSCDLCCHSDLLRRSHYAG